ncbi:hypothetical protein EMPG_16979 [Blastomyces silverae]|uniref:Uncharacterized protein n=1 Tax=Blastomyces silverae TaxID=2060906 RepID=A0A0H1B941_9EURO|nr:hypothetical protein EMPG_16979 [Blastomyces silverae]
MVKISDVDINTTSPHYHILTCFWPGISVPKWNYHISDDPLKGDGSHRSIVYKAEVIPKDATASVDAPRWAFIKMPSPEHEASANELQVEHDIYRLPSVRSAATFWKLYNMSSDSMDMGKTDPKSIRYAAFEWLKPLCKTWNTALTSIPMP